MLKWLSDLDDELAGVFLLSLAAGVRAFFAWRDKRKREITRSAQLTRFMADHASIAGHNISAKAEAGGRAIITTGHLTINADETAKSLVEDYKKQLSSAEEREGSLQDQIKALTEAITALPNQTQIVNAKTRIAEALKALEPGNTAPAEDIFQEVVNQGLAARQTAEAARHLGALAFLHDTNKALKAYEQAVARDPENSEGWNKLGRLKNRTGDLDGAVAAYKKVVEIGLKRKDRACEAAGYGNLGLVYQTHGDLDRALEMHENARKINTALGPREGLANNYSNLGNVYQIRGDLDRARGLYQQSLALFQDLGNPQMIQQVQGLLDKLEGNN